MIDRNVVLGQYSAGTVAGEGCKAVTVTRRQCRLRNQEPRHILPAGSFIDNWRWAGVPFYIRAGKRLNKTAHRGDCPVPATATAICSAALAMSLLQTYLRFSIQPKEEIAWQLNAKRPGDGNQAHPVNLTFNYESFTDTQQRPAYERLLLDCIKGNPMLFARQDGVEAMWGIVDPIIRALGERFLDKDCFSYPAGSWGPKEADDLIAMDKRKWVNV
jgi:glucose-6-phosphate 1-dehydrogenase